MINDNGESHVTFLENGSYQFSGTDYYAGDEAKNLSHYEAGDKISVKLTYNKDTSSIINIEYLNLVEDVRKVKGDINVDGVFNVTYLVVMQKWLLAVPDTTLADWKAGDLYEDDSLDVFDLGLMKRMLIEQ